MFKKRQLYLGDLSFSSLHIIHVAFFSRLKGSHWAVMRLSMVNIRCSEKLEQLEKGINVLYLGIKRKLR